MDINTSSAEYLEKIYYEYLQNPDSVSVEWRNYFSNLNEKAQVHVEKHLAQSEEGKQTKINKMINAYRMFGHLHADIDPLKMREELLVPELMLSYYHLTQNDLNTVFEVSSLPGERKRPLKEILEDLKKIYCGTIASEFMHIPDSAERIWVQEHVEEMCTAKALSPEIQHHILGILSAAEGLEKYLGAKYPGAKRFSLEGTDSLLVGLDQIVQRASEKGYKEIVIGMAHRGRLNVLINLLGKTPSLLFDEFENKHDIHLESGDVKYHQGFSSDIESTGGLIHLSLAFNPSHLEIVTPVISGSVCARQKRLHDKAASKVLCVALHGDAAFAGQGVVMEILNMSKTRGYAVGGTIHILVNNQIGFTTSNPHDARSTLYCSDIGKMIQIPIFHVNANDPEAVYRVVNLSLEYRDTFKKDVIIDLVGYRRHGHNEADEPAVTQPGMYQIIRKMPTCFEMYTQKLISDDIISQESADQLLKDYQASLDAREKPLVRNLVKNDARCQNNGWGAYYHPEAKDKEDWRMWVKTAVPIEIIKALAQKLESLPEDLVLHPRVKRIIEDRQKMSQGEISLDWGYAEIMAYATLINEGTLVRMSGQDSGRGTFFHRHAVLHNQDVSKKDFIPLDAISNSEEGSGSFTIIDSLLSESAVLGFEYGFSCTIPGSLVIWEAQFGDFVNNAQVVIDQFISSGEQKWGRLSGLTLFLPHGYEGMGAEHSSARLERFLQLCAENNIQVCIPSTPAQMFHLLRRQVVRKIRKPLIVLTPKSLLRHKLAVSSLEELSTGSFKPILAEIDEFEIKKIKRVVFCSGKIYYELLEKRRLDKRTDVVIIRIEQLYPFPDQESKKILQEYKTIKKIIWCQEEPENQGAWYYIKHQLHACLEKGQILQYAGRPPAAAPAVGYHHLHELQQAAVVTEALG